MSSVLVIGRGGREHALAWKLRQSHYVERVYCAPGNGGTHEVAANVPIPADMAHAAELVEFVRQKRICLVVIGPDDLVVAGLGAYFRGVATVFTPSQEASFIEGDKGAAKDFMLTHAIPTAGYSSFTNSTEALRFAEKRPLPMVIKDNGLARGQGVKICFSREQARAAIQWIMLDKTFGSSGERIILEDYLPGVELSAHALCDGYRYLPFPFARDHKSLTDSSLGRETASEDIVMTGGMGVVAPVPALPGEIEYVADQIIQRTLQGLTNSKCHFAGCLYPGLMRTISGLKVLEYNARFGDPEAQAYMRLLQGDLYELLYTCVGEDYIGRTIDGFDVEWSGHVATVTLACAGYPTQTSRGEIISGLKKARLIPGVEIFHGGTVYEDGEYYTNGGRILHVTALADDLATAIARAYEAVECIHFTGMQYRRDIGQTTLQEIQS